MKTCKDCTHRDSDGECDVRDYQKRSALARACPDHEVGQWIRIDGERIDVEQIHTYGDLSLLDLDGGQEWYVARDSDEAGEAAKAYWRDMASNDPEEFTCIVGKEALIAWALGQYASPGSTPCNSLEAWLDLTATVPEEQWASYDGAECDVDGCSSDLVEELGFLPTVAYRHN